VVPVKTQNAQDAKTRTVNLTKLQRFRHMIENCSGSMTSVTVIASNSLPKGNKS